MTQPTFRAPYDHALFLINQVNKAINRVAALPDGTPRDLDGPATAGVLGASSNLAIASALLAVADALRVSPIDQQKG
ncbi:hypothetical protein GCM10018980_52040 [Streptomyces capoamus]|uniref:Uncharacterized protein n=1 Tax=Streptomyces capoamus TaxID=68183 RepID=A0A919KE48_9ACTN|nr:hypothetical protein [Streptomyces capoamus]GGW15724.1 hypothetical protein GCM10010501_28780 [Streptomyces libani subsp. rufus]GHG62245.1 hypothetical protein GCM10018980_52040 [Streptomyces capoamus]